MCLIASSLERLTLDKCSQEVTAIKGDISMTNIKLGDKVVRDSATVNEGTVRLGEAAPMFRPIRSGDKVVRDAASQDQGKVRLGEAAPMFRPIRSGDKVVRDATSQDQGKVRLGEAAPMFHR
jgi:CRISPR/Cas system CMR subunit Cmr4 (Cas7 group RAMP superfamily)